jgi:plastocyanin
MRPRLNSRGGLVRSIVMASTAALLIALLASAAASAVGGGREQRAPLRADTARVDIHEFAFHPHKLTVTRGTKVVFANSDSTAHTATSAGNFATGHIRPGHSAAVKFKHSGVFAYHCSIHNFMHGKIVVR